MLLRNWSIGAADMLHVEHGVLFGLLLSGCAMSAESRAEAREDCEMEPRRGIEEQRLERAALDYIASTKKWRADQFRLEHARSENPREARVLVVFIEDERRGREGAVGGGQSVLLCIDRKDYRVVRELHFQ